MGPLVAVMWQRFASEKEGDREVQRTMLELLNQLDGFSSTSEVKVREEEEEKEEEEKEKEEEDEKEEEEKEELEEERE